MFTVKSNQPAPRRALAALPWGQVPRSRRRQVGHGRAESRSIKVVDLDGHPARTLFPHAARAIEVVRSRRRAATATTIAADLGAWGVVEDESGQGLRPPTGRTWGRRGRTPVVRVTAAIGPRVSVAGCWRPGPDSGRG